MDSGMHEELPDWMSELFKKLDMEASEDSICSTGNVAQGEAHPIAHEVISSKIHMPTKLKDMSMTHRDSSSLEWIPIKDRYYFFDNDAFLDQMEGWLKKGGYYDARHNNVQGGLSHLDEDAEDSHMSMKGISNKEALEKGIKWMSEECFLAFTESGERDCLKDIEHKFGELQKQCFNTESYHKIFHHYNFTVEAKSGSDIWSSKLYFAEVKQLFGLKSYFCCLLEPTDNGRCYGCQNMKCDLQHPSRGGYEEGSADMGWPFIDDGDSDSDG